MIALIRYTVASLLHSQRYLAPLLLYLGALGVLSTSDSGPLPPVYASFAGAMFVCSTWFTMALLSIEDPVHRAITVVSAGRSHRVLLASMSVVALSCLVMTGAGLGIPMLMAGHPVTGLDLLVGTEAQLTCAAVGTAIGLLCSRPVLRRPGFALVVALGLMGLALFTPGLPPVNTVVRALGGATTSAGLLGPVTGLLALSLGVLAVSGVLTQIVVTRRA